MAGHLLLLVLMCYHSPESNVSSIIIQTPRPKLTVNTTVITETDSVTLNCQTPSSVSVSQCYFYTVKEQTAKVFSCVKTLSGTELLNMAHQSSPAVVELTCYYTAEHRGGQYQSLHSNTSSITIQHIIKSTSSMAHTVYALVNNVRIQMPTQQAGLENMKKTSEHTLRPGEEGISEAEKEAGLTVSSTSAFTPVPPTTPVSSDKYLWIWKLMVAGAGSGVSLGIILMVSALLSTQKRTDGCGYVGRLNTGEYLPAGYDDTYSIITCEFSNIDSFSLIKAQALLPPKLTVNMLVITETDSVTLNCQTPSSVSVSHCHFNTVRGGSVRASSCLKTLTGTELLNMAHQSSPAVVEVTCYYTVNGEFSSASSHSHISYIIINKRMIWMIGAGVTLGVLVLGLALLFNQSRIALPPPKLTVNPPVISETDSVIGVKDSSSVPVSQCYFYNVREETKVFSCVKTLTGTELLLMAHQRSPAVVELRCFYTGKIGGSDSPSPHSDTSSITINSE
ncbi:flocculation protein FLO11-like isoform X3 [Lates japonicus]|uniref:Flocculation protein FLO11-like isoform X3 n=1 Tax=Lates japonicus TaxID=270547 RepID=A0AAD3N2C4_LATJO|nr:flocculation protein FLO11-like isoform X3 [Lates japonicus]